MSTTSLTPRVAAQRWMHLVSRRAFKLTSLFTLGALGTTSALRPFTASSTSSTSASSDMTALPKAKSEQEWQAQLSPEQFRILRKKGTEMAGSGEYDKHFPATGVYECAGCGEPLYKAETKFNSG